jgi:prolyl-tRNA synthetase
MKDAYSFHTTQSDLEEYYERCYEAYERIFARAGIPEVTVVKSDSGMMGGKVAHEFMLLCEAGEDTIVICQSCDFRSNIEVADCVIENAPAEDGPLVSVATPGVKTIDDVCAFFRTTADKTCKAVIYRKNATDEPVVVFIRGDLEVNETKLRNFLKEDIHPVSAESSEPGIVYGSTGPVGFSAKAAVLYDSSLKGTHGLICGANKADHHYSGFTPGRDVQEEKLEFNDFAKMYEGAICPSCGKNSIIIRNGIEVGNIFQLGVKYTTSMDMRYADKDGNLQYPIMGCYGIGVGRLAASVCEAHHDDYGPIWPISIAPWHVHICAIRSDNPDVMAAASALYDALQNAGIEVIYDDRIVSAGVMFSDADLLGVPVRATISPKTCSRGAVEISARDKSFSEDVPAESAVEYIVDLVMRKLSECIN